MIRKVCFFGPKKMRFMQTESVLQTKNRSGPAKNRFSVALGDRYWEEHLTNTIRIVRRCEVWTEKSFRGSLFCITRLCPVMPYSDPEGRIFLSAPNNHDRFFFLHTFWSLAFDFNVGVTSNESHSYMLTSAILKVDVVCDVAMTLTPNVLTKSLHGLLYN